MTDAEGAPTRVSGGLARVAASEDDGEFDVMAAMGGVRGMVESALPTLVFAVGYGVSKALTPCLVAALGVAVAVLLVRLITRTTVMPAVSGLMGVGLAVGIAWWTHSAEGFFFTSIAKNVFFLALYAGSLPARWPLVGVQLGFILGEGTRWREVPARVRVYQWATVLWAAMFGIRLLFQIPMLKDGNITGLGLASVPLGLPLYGLVLLGTWGIVRREPIVRQPDEPAADDQGDVQASGTAPAVPEDPDDEPVRSGAAG